MLVATARAGAEESIVGLSALQARLQGHVASHAEPRHFWAQARANRRARQRVGDLFSRYGYDVRLQGPYHNVIALPRRVGGTSLPAVCAHYDSVPSTPGADDNASALALMLEVAHLAARDGVPLVAIAFNAEEDDLAGSRDFAASYRATPLPVSIRIAHVLEMVGFTAPVQHTPPAPRWLQRRIPATGDFIGIVGNRRSASHLDDVVELASSTPRSPPVVGLKALWGIERRVPDLLRSDHAPLWRAGIPALLWTDTANFRNPNYHQPTDTPETLDYGFMARVSMLLARAIEATPC